ncbi:DUF397 domain-containing protein [Streptomyces sp. NPDC000609]|uniref:DUF397 domain-containing protein n=1 Tax=Streptomyces sp. NPDC000609 TaxID=3160957 RepID=UPI0033995E38
MSSQEVVSPFVKSSFSGGGSANECVEVAHTADGGRAVRGSRNRDGGLQERTRAHAYHAWAHLRRLPGSARLVSGVPVDPAS